MSQHLELFNRLDANGNGYVSKEELKQGIQELGFEIAESEIDSFMTHIDTDGDGRISQPEFEVFLKAHDPANANLKEIYNILNMSLPMLKKTSSMANQAPLEKRVRVDF
jgi:hypothetical protein